MIAVEVEDLLTQIQVQHVINICIFPHSVFDELLPLLLSIEHNELMPILELG